MGGHGKNGNRTKGNSEKKNRRRVDPYAEKEETDLIGRVYRNDGQHITVELPTENEDGEKLIKCRISGRMWKKIWFNKGDILVITHKFSEKIYEIKGKVNDAELRDAKKLFQDMDNKDEDLGVLIGDEDLDDEQDHDDMILGVNSKLVKNENHKNSTKQESNKNITIPTKKVQDEDSSSVDSINIDDL